MLLRQKNVIGNLNKTSLSQQSACQNYGPTLVQAQGWFDLCNIKQIALIGISGNIKVYLELFFIIVKINQA